MAVSGNRYYVLARKWRPQQFDEVVGQEHITRTLKNAVSTGRIHHALLFIGSRGIGKTTTARILAKALNCTSTDKPTPTPCDRCSNCVEISQGTHLDVQEIDGASNNSVDNIREIREAVRLAPASARYKVYIIDEVHQLSSAAFNALLKTLEEPPSHAVFILATTEAHKIPATIVSRCQRYNFRRVAVDDIVRLLENIVRAEKRKATREALFAIARSADGAVRDAESILDQLMTYCEGEITFKDVQEVLGLIDVDKLDRLVYAVLEKDLASILAIIDDVSVSGKDLTQFVEELLRHFRNLLILKVTNDPSRLFLPDEDIQRLKEQANRFSVVQLIRLIENLSQLNQSFSNQLSHRTALEAFFIKSCKVGVELSVETILEKLLQLEEFLRDVKLPSVSKVEVEPGTVPSKEKKKLNKPTPVLSEPNPISISNTTTLLPHTKRVDESAQIPQLEPVDTRPLWDKVYEALSHDDSILALKLSKVEQMKWDSRLGIAIIYIKHGDNFTNAIINEISTKNKILHILNGLGYDVKELQVEYIESPKAVKKSNPVPTHVQSSGNDIVAIDLHEKIQQNPELQALISTFKGKIVKVLPLEGSSSELLTTKEMFEDTDITEDDSD